MPRESHVTSSGKPQMQDYTGNGIVVVGAGLAGLFTALIARRTLLASLTGALIVLGQHFEERPDPKPSRPVFLSQLYCAPGMPGRGLGAGLLGVGHHSPKIDCISASSGMRLSRAG